MSRFSKHGHYQTTARDGRPLLIVFQHEDEARTEEDVVNTVMILRDFAAEVIVGGQVCHSINDIYPNPHL
jgi:hypothetical protein